MRYPVTGFFVSLSLVAGITTGKKATETFNTGQLKAVPGNMEYRTATDNRPVNH